MDTDLLGGFVPEGGVVRRLADELKVLVTIDGTEVPHGADPKSRAGSVVVSLVNVYSHFYGRNVKAVMVRAVRGGAGSRIRGRRETMLNLHNWRGNRRDSAIQEAIQGQMTWAAS